MRALFTEVKLLAVVEMYLDRILIFGDHRARTKDRVAKTFLMPDWFRSVFGCCRLALKGDALPVGVTLADRCQGGS